MQNSQLAMIIKTLCKKNNITINTLIEVCSLTKSIIYDLEKRNKTPSIEKIERIADYFNVSIDYLIGRTSYPEINTSPVVEKNTEKIENNSNKESVPKAVKSTVIEPDLEENSENIIQVPLSYLKVSAGTGCYIFDDFDNIERELIDVNINKHPIARKADFAIQVKGDSMEPNYHDGDTLLIRSQPALDNGDIGVFNLNGDGYVKKYYKDQYGIVTFVSINENYPPIILSPGDEVTVFGRVLCAL